MEPRGRSNAKREPGSFEIFRGEFLRPLQVGLGNLGFSCLLWAFQNLSVITASDDGIFGYRVNEL